MNCQLKGKLNIEWLYISSANELICIMVTYVRTVEYPEKAYTKYRHQMDLYLASIAFLLATKSTSLD